MIYSLLEEMHPDAHCELNYKTDFELLIAVILSAQCTDKRVNTVTEQLFQVCDTPEGFAAMPHEELERRIFSCGFYRNKAKNIIAASKALLEKFGGIVPCDFDGLNSLPGVGRKTANVVMSVAFGKDAIAVDTHVFRVANRTGLVSAKTPESTEMQLTELFPPEYRSRLHHLLIFHGRYVCHSRKPECERCLLRDKCYYYRDNNL